MRKLVFIINPVSGNSSAIRVLPTIKKYFEDYEDDFKIEYRISRNVSDIKKIAEEYYQNDYREFFVVGGDGSLSELVNVLVPKNDLTIKIGVIPFGSGNDFIKSLKPNFKIEDLLESILKDNCVIIDVGKVNEYYFVNSCTFGIDGPIIKYTDRLKKKMNGKVAYYLSTIYAGLIFKSSIVEVKYNGKVTQNKKMLISICNGKYIGGGMIIAPGAKLNDQKLDLCIIEDISKLKFLMNVMKVYSGNLDKLNEVTYDKITELEVSVAGNGYDINVDGTLVGKTPAKIKIIENAIKIFK